MNIALFAHGTQAHTGCMLNGQPIDCGELANKAEPFIGFGLAILAFIGIILVAVFVFWLLMLIHAIQHNSPDRTLWIVVLLASFFTGFALIGAIVYFFAEKKRAEAAPLATSQPTNLPAETATPTKDLSPDPEQAESKPTPEKPTQK